jgi:L-2,4-diaminobutyrate decarboxylase
MSKNIGDSLNTSQNSQSGNSARWRGELKLLQAAFPSPWQDAGEDQSFEATFRSAVALLNGMKHPRAFQNQNAWQGYLGDPALPDYTACRDARLEDRSKPLSEVIEELVRLFNGMPNWNHPQTMANVVPPANTAAIIGATLANVFNPNILEGEYSWNVAKTEIESAAMMAGMIGWDPHSSGGLFTFRGTGCYLYGLKLALTTVLGKDSRYSGIREDAQVLVSRAGHFAKLNCTDWTGLGMNNIRAIEVDEHNRMSIPHLRETMESCRREGRPVVMIVCTMGTTDAFAIDPIAAVREAIDEYQNANGCPRPFLYADAVIGWSWLAFNHYDFERNPLQFSPPAPKAMEQNHRQIKPLYHADGIGIDFHKTGWATYNCSLFMAKDYGKFAELLERPSPAYLQDRTPYNPFNFTLETSRTGAYSMAGWATLRLFGRDGFRVMLGRIIEVELFFRQLLMRTQNLVCVNPDNFGFVTLFRVYPKHIDANAQYEKDLRDPQAGEELLAFNLLQQRVANKLFAMLRDPAQKVPGWENPPYTSFTMGFRPPAYAPGEQDRRRWVYALKAFPMSPNSNELSMLMVRNYVLKARDLVIEEILEQGEDAAAAAIPVRSAPPSAPRTTDNWWGDNEAIHPRYLTGSHSVGVKSKRSRASAHAADAGLTAGEAKIEDILAKIPVCGHLTADELKGLMAIGTRVAAEANHLLFSEEDAADKVYLILSEGRRSRCGIATALIPSWPPWARASFSERWRCSIGGYAPRA